MHYGNIVFIKKSGGDGSKFPVTNKSVKIGRSDDCIIRIQNPLVSSEHCQVIVDDNGQAKVRNLSKVNPTHLNEKPLGSGVFALGHCDVLKLGERYARWEYLPSSKYFSAAKSSLKLSVGVGKKTESTSSAMATAVKFNAAPKRRYSDKVTTKVQASVSKISRLSLGPGRVATNRSKVVGRSSLQLKKLAFSPQVKLRKCVLENSSETVKLGSAKKTPVRNSQNWTVKPVTPPNEGQSSKQLATNRKLTPIKLPRLSKEKLLKSTANSASKIPNLLPIAEFTEMNNTSPFAEKTQPPHSSANVSVYGSPKSPSKLIKTPSPKKIRLSSPRKSLLKSNKKGFMMFDEAELSSESASTSRKFTPTVKTPLKKSMLNKSNSESDFSASESKSRSSKTSLEATEIGKKFQVMVKLSPIKLDEQPSGSAQSSSPIPVITPMTLRPPRRSKILTTSTPKYGERLPSGKGSIPSGVLSTPKDKRTSRGKLCSSCKKTIEASAKKTEHGTKRKFTSVIASADMAAKKLKTIAPTKPDKNKKAALLVLGKATRPLKTLQSSNVVIKQKIVKKAIKQSTKGRKASRKIAAARKKSVKRSSAEKKTPSPKSGQSPSGRKSASSESADSLETGSPVGKSRGGRNSRGSLISDKPKITTPSKRGTESTVAPPGSVNPQVSGESVPFRQSDAKDISPSSFSAGPGPQQNSLNAFPSAVRRSAKVNLPSFNGQPEFTELSPIALGLTPKNAEMFKTPKQIGRRSSSMVTPKNKSVPVGLKSASTSKIHRKSVRFSNKDLNETFGDLSVTSSSFRLEDICTPNLTVDIFVSPLSEQKSLSGKSLDSPMTRTARKDLLEVGTSMRSPMNDLSNVQSSSVKSPNNAKKLDSDLVTSEKKQESDSEVQKQNKQQKSPKNDLTDVNGVRKLMASSRPRKSPKNDLTDVRGVKRLMEPPKPQKSPKNDLTDVRGVKRLMEPPKSQKSPKNDLTDVRGVKRLMEPPKPQKSPKNDLTDVRGVKRLLESSRPRKSPKNDLSDVRGVKTLMRTPRQQKSPKNDLTDVAGVKQLLTSRSPENDLTNVSGVEKLFRLPPNKLQCLRTLYNPIAKSPENDLRDVAGVRELFSLAKDTDNLEASLTGVAELFRTPERSKMESNLPSLDVKLTRISERMIASEKSEKSRTKASPGHTQIKKTTRRTTTLKAETSSETEPETIVQKGKSTATSAVRTEESKGSNFPKKLVSKSSQSPKKRQTARAEDDPELSPTPPKRTKTALREKTEGPAKKRGPYRKKKPEVAEDTTPKSKPSPIRGRRKSVAQLTPEAIKRDRRSSEEVGEEAPTRMKRKYTRRSNVVAEEAPTRIKRKYTRRSNVVAEEAPPRMKRKYTGRSNVVGEEAPTRMKRKYTRKSNVVGEEAPTQMKRKYTRKTNVVAEEAPTQMKRKYTRKSNEVGEEAPTRMKRKYTRRSNVVEEETPTRMKRKYTRRSNVVGEEAPTRMKRKYTKRSNVVAEEAPTRMKRKYTRRSNVVVEEAPTRMKRKYTRKVMVNKEKRSVEDHENVRLSRRSEPVWSEENGEISSASGRE